ncbi:hypothetical protein HDV64DRAFT_202638 [Trichoderma sp. TUCIM 5745]
MAATPTHRSYTSKVYRTYDSEAYSTPCPVETKRREQRTLDESAYGSATWGPAIEADGKHLSATLNSTSTLRPGGSSSVLGCWTFGSLCLMGGLDPRQHNQARDAQSDTTAVAGLSRGWGLLLPRQTGARASVLRLSVLAIRLVGTKHHLAYQYALARALAQSSTPRLIPAFTATQQTPRASGALLGENCTLASETWDGGAHQQPESLRATPGSENADISGRKWPETCPERRMSRHSQVRRSETRANLYCE